MRRPLAYLIALNCAVDLRVFSAKADSDPLQLDARDNLAFSPPHYPSPWADPNADGWQAAYAQARDFVSQLTLLEKVNLTTGVG